MPKFRKKPVVIEAETVRTILAAAAHSWKQLPKWVADAYDNGNILFLNQEMSIKTLEGRMTANIDDMLILGVAGEIYPCKPDIFEKTYEPVIE